MTTDSISPISVPHYCGAASLLRAALRRREVLPMCAAESPMLPPERLHHMHVGGGGFGVRSRRRSVSLGFARCAAQPARPADPARGTPPPCD